jgi:hypothetical protein
MATLWSVGKRSAIFGVRLFSRLLIKSFTLKNKEPLNLFVLESPHYDHEDEESPFQSFVGN